MRLVNNMHLTTRVHGTWVPMFLESYLLIKACKQTVNQTVHSLVPSSSNIFTCTILNGVHMHEQSTNHISLIKQAQMLYCKTGLVVLTTDRYPGCINIANCTAREAVSLLFQSIRMSKSGGSKPYRQSCTLSLPLIPILKPLITPSLQPPCNQDDDHSVGKTANFSDQKTSPQCCCCPHMAAESSPPVYRENTSLVWASAWAFA